MRICKFSFISVSTVSPLKKSRKRFVGEESTVRCSIIKFIKYLWVSDFNFLSDCSVLQTIFQSVSNVTHVVHRWRAKLLQCQFAIWNLPERMMWECDMLLQYKKIHRIVERQWYGEYINRSDLGSTLRVGKISCGPSSIGTIHKG